MTCVCVRSRTDTATFGSLAAVVDASRPDESFFEVRKITSGKVYGMRVFQREAAIRRGLDHIGLLSLATRKEVPFMVRLHSTFR